MSCIELCVICINVSIYVGVGLMGGGKKTGISKRNCFLYPNLTPKIYFKKSHLFLGRKRCR